jgi:hypothetical protein
MNDDIKPRKLQLSRETVRILTGAMLDGVMGGAPTPSGAGGDKCTQQNVGSCPKVSMQPEDQTCVCNTKMICSQDQCNIRPQPVPQPIPWPIPLL